MLVIGLEAGKLQKARLAAPMVLFLDIVPSVIKYGSHYELKIESVLS